MSLVQNPSLPDERSQRTAEHRFGISAAMTTPFNADFSIDTGLLATHATRLLAEGCSSLTLFGTTGEGPSVAAAEREGAYGHVLRGGIPASGIVMCVGSPALGTAVEHARIALSQGGRWLLVMPPFYFKGIDDDGLMAWYSAFIESLAAHEPRIILYHIPQVTGVAITLPLWRGLRDRFGTIIAGIKDSAGHWPTTQAFLDEPGAMVLVGDERHLAAAARLGCAGSISGMANQFPAQLAGLLDTGADNPALNALVDAVVSHPVTPAVKTIVGTLRGEAGWSRVRAPLQPTPLPIATELATMARALAEQRQ